MTLKNKGCDIPCDNKILYGIKWLTISVYWSVYCEEHFKIRIYQIEAQEVSKPASTNQTEFNILAIYDM